MKVMQGAWNDSWTSVCSTTGPPMLGAVVDAASRSASSGRSAVGVSPQAERTSDGSKRWNDVWTSCADALRGLPAVVTDSVQYRALAALLAARQGDSATARSIQAELAAPDPPWTFGETTFWRARIHAALGDSDTALDLLRRSFAEGRGGPTWQEVHVSRDFDPLRGTPSFAALIRPESWPGPGATP